MKKPFAYALLIISLSFAVFTFVVVNKAEKERKQADKEYFSAYSDWQKDYKGEYPTAPTGKPYLVPFMVLAICFCSAGFGTSLVSLTDNN